MQHHDNGPGGLVHIVCRQNDSSRAVCLCVQQQLLSQCLLETPQFCRRGRDGRGKEGGGCDGDEQSRAHGSYLCGVGGCLCAEWCGVLWVCGL